MNLKKINKKSVFNDSQDSLNATPSGARKKIVIAGCRNAGKSSFINALTSQEIAIVSSVPGTTADPVYKNMEILPIGPVTIIDTAGIDDIGKLGKLRVKKSLDVIKIADFTFYIVAADVGFSNKDINFIKQILETKKKVCIIINKIDKLSKNENLKIPKDIENLQLPIFYVSCKQLIGIEKVKTKLAEIFPNTVERFIVSDLIQAGDIIVLVVPIDLSAPKGRLILPQVQTIREILDADAIAITVKERELKYALNNLSQPPKLVITDSQAIMKVSADVPESIPLTTFSVLFARYKGELPALMTGLKTLKNLKDNDKILIIEACTHHTQPDDLGRVKIPRWLINFTGKKLKFDFFAGRELPSAKETKKYKLAIHCGGCMLTQQEMQARLEIFKNQKLPIINYGIIISYLHNAFPRVLKIFPEYADAYF